MENRNTVNEIAIDILKIQASHIKKKSTLKVPTENDKDVMAFTELYKAISENIA